MASNHSVNITTRSPKQQQKHREPTKEAAHQLSMDTTTAASATAAAVAEGDSEVAGIELKQLKPSENGSGGGGGTVDHSKHSPRTVRSSGGGEDNNNVRQSGQSASSSTPRHRTPVKKAATICGDNAGDDEHHLHLHHQQPRQTANQDVSPAKKSLQEGTTETAESAAGQSIDCAGGDGGDEDSRREGTAATAATSKPKPPPLKIMDLNTSTASAQSQSQCDSAPKTPLTPGPSSATAAEFARKRQAMDKERKIGHRRVDEEGQVTYKKIQTSQIMGSIQLGIGHAVGSLASKPERDLLMKDFMEIETVAFSKEGSNTTPAHHYSDFKFKIYAPTAFRYFRDLFGIQPDDFLLSLCNEPLRELSNPGASGSVFYLTTDDNFIIKTVMLKEAEFLLKLLPGYYMNLNQNPRTLLPKFFGQYCYICGGKNVRIITMNNLLPSTVKMHQKYDLKGSTYKRKAGKYERKKESPTFKDLDFIEHHPEGIYLESETYSALIKTMTRDCRVLESFKIMDYSLLVGVHNLDQANREREERQREQANHYVEMAAAELSQTSFEQADPPSISNDNSMLTRTKSVNKQRIAAFSTALESIQADIDPIDQEEDVPPGGIPARNEQGERLLLYIGIIDILQSYRFKKKLEHTFKAMLHDGDTISVHKPGFYAQRFLDFMSKTVFKKITSLDLPEIKGPHRKFRTLVSSYIGLALKPPNKRNKAQITARQKSSSISGPGPTSKVNKASAQHMPPHRYPLDNSRYLRTAVIKQAANKQSVILENHASNAEHNNELSVTSSCASSFTSSGLGSTLRTVTWTPPHSIGTVTPSHTEGTPSLTESSESESECMPAEKGPRQSVETANPNSLLSSSPSSPSDCPNTPARSRSSTRYSRSTLADEAEAGGDGEVLAREVVVASGSLGRPPAGHLTAVLTTISEDRPS